jgi:phenylacetate-CoA ligase
MMIFRSLSQIRSLHRNQYLDTRQLKDLQNEKVRRIVRHAYTNVDYYHQLFRQAGLKPDDIRGVEDLVRIPVTTKSDLQKLRPDQILAKGVRPEECVVKYTSGSTGHPLKTFLSPAERDYQILLNLRILMENGLKLKDRMVYIINPHRFPKSKYWFQPLGILRRDYLSVFDFPQVHAHMLKRLGRGILYGYPSNLTILALYCRENNVRWVNPKVVFSVAEALEPKSREVIDSVFNVSTCDILGTIELGDIAWQCEQREGYHLSADAVIVEMLKDGKPVNPGEEGKTVCTSLYGYTMPLIRYAVDDIFVPSIKTCRCGRTLPLIERIQGRANDFIILPDGQIVASCFLVITMQSFHEVDQYRVIQENRKGLRVQIVKGRDFRSDTCENVKREIETAVQNKLEATIEILDQIPRDPSGKIRTVVSRIAPDLQCQLDQNSGARVDPESPSHCEGALR